ncbi:Lrp/AsnC family transcriptional regulator [Fodinicola acaciae]|uniref:Lrp/AsnC family transcriptional regulator n=1 Tax=Fodinicola acaciae TaxID=2681555 RepID=UPI0013D40E2D|nr:Lrp/AsnC family transcriptional regulator [Fodinicola acaciae]
MVHNPDRLDQTDARLLRALTDQPRATTIALAERLGMSRNTVQARLSRLERDGLLESFERRIAPRTLGYPLSAYVTTQVTQRRLDEVGAALAQIPEVLQVQGISGQTDLMVQVVATDGDDLYRVAGEILAIPGVERTSTALVMRELVDYRISPLLRRLCDEPADSSVS